MKKRSDVEFFEGLFLLIGFYALIGICAFLIFDNVKHPKKSIRKYDLSKAKQAFKK